eukprot:995930-Amphidinium_carterae.2
MGWQAEPRRGSRGRWIRRANGSPHKKTYMLNDGYARLTIRVERAAAEKERVCPSEATGPEAKASSGGCQ